jgi:hypothetical protein
MKINFYFYFFLFYLKILKMTKCECKLEKCVKTTRRLVVLIILRRRRIIELERKLAIVNVILAPLGVSVGDNPYAFFIHAHTRARRIRPRGLNFPMERISLGLDTPATPGVPSGNRLFGLEELGLTSQQFSRLNLDAELTGLRPQPKPPLPPQNNNGFMIVDNITNTLVSLYPLAADRMSVITGPGGRSFLHMPLAVARRLRRANVLRFKRVSPTPAEDDAEDDADDDDVDDDDADDDAEDEVEDEVEVDTAEGHIPGRPHKFNIFTRGHIKVVIST